MGRRSSHSGEGRGYRDKNLGNFSAGGQLSRGATVAREASSDYYDTETSRELTVEAIRERMKLHRARMRESGF